MSRIPSAEAARRIGSVRSMRWSRPWAGSGDKEVMGTAVMNLMAATAAVKSEAVALFAAKADKKMRAATALISISRR